MLKVCRDWSFLYVSSAVQNNIYYFLLVTFITYLLILPHPLPIPEHYITRGLTFTHSLIHSSSAQNFSCSS